MSNIGVPYLPSQNKNNMFTNESLHSTISHRHILMKGPDFLMDEDNAYWVDPAWPRNNYAPDLSNYENRRRSPDVSKGHILRDSRLD